MARPTKNNPEWKQTKPKLDNVITIQKLEQAFSLDCSIPEACLYAWICKQSYYNLLKARPELVDRFEALRNRPVLIARETVVKACQRNPEIALKYLERKRRNEFSTKTEVDNRTEVVIKEEDLID